MAFTEHMTEAQQLAHTLGVVVGAASCCEQVTDERVNSIAVKLRHLISTTANDTADADDAPSSRMPTPPRSSTKAHSAAIRLTTSSQVNTLAILRPP